MYTKVVIINFTPLVKIISTASSLIVICYNTSLTFISNIKIENEILIQNIFKLFYIYLLAKWADKNNQNNNKKMFTYIIQKCSIPNA
jgi:hypothetical protein